MEDRILALTFPVEKSTLSQSGFHPRQAQWNYFVHMEHPSHTVGESGICIYLGTLTVVFSMDGIVDAMASHVYPQLFSYIMCIQRIYSI